MVLTGDLWPYAGYGLTPPDRSRNGDGSRITGPYRRFVRLRWTAPGTTSCVPRPSVIQLILITRSRTCKAGELTGDGHTAKSSYLSGLPANSLSKSTFGYLVHRESSVVNMEKSLELTEDGHPIRQLVDSQ